MGRESVCWQNLISEVYVVVDFPHKYLVDISDLYLEKIYYIKL